MIRPFTILSCLLLVGITIAYFTGLSLSSFLFLGILILLALLIFICRDYAYLLLGIAVILLGIFIFSNTMETLTLLKNSDMQNQTIKVRIEGNRRERFNYTEYDIIVQEIIFQNSKVKINEKSKLQIVNNDILENELQKGDIVIVQRARLKESFADKDLGNYMMYLKSRGYRSILQADAKNIKYAETSCLSNFLTKSYRTKKYIEEYLDIMLSATQASLMKSILFGNQGYMEPEIMQDFSKSGTAHIVAVSGLHIGIIILILDKFLQLLSISRKKILGITMLVLLFYAYIVGFPVSIIRAGTMYYLYVFSYFLDRRYDSINSLMLIAFALLIYNPLNIISVSFQLSFAATLSILLFYPMLYKKMKLLPKYIAGLLAVTLSAQIGTIPIMAFHFKSISMISLFANLFIVPTLAILLTLCFLSIAVGLVFPLGGFAISVIVNYILSYILWVVKKAASIPYASITVENVPLIILIIYYVMIIIIYLMYKRRQIFRNNFQEKGELYNCEF